MILLLEDGLVGQLVCTLDAQFGGSLRLTILDCARLVAIKADAQAATKKVQMELAPKQSLGMPGGAGQEAYLEAMRGGLVIYSNSM